MGELVGVGVEEEGEGKSIIEYIVCAYENMRIVCTYYI
jgi:hypothetical protein